MFIRKEAGGRRQEEGGRRQEAGGAIPAQKAEGRRQEERGRRKEGGRRKSLNAPVWKSKPQLF